MQTILNQPIRRILIPTDFSQNAMNAAEYAVQLAIQIKARVVLFHATHVPVFTSAESMEALSVEDLEKESLSRLEKVVNTLREKFAFEEIDCQTSCGFAVDEITKLTTEEKFDMVVMGTKGSSGILEITIGSNTAEVIEKCRCPVLAIPSEASFKPFSRLAFATNYAENDFQTLFLLAEMVRTLKSEIVVLHVDDTDDHNVESRKLESFKEQLQTNIPFDRFSFNMVRSKNIIHAIHDFIEENSIDLLVVSTRRRKFIDKLTSRSITRKLAFHTHIPLLAFHAFSGNNPSF